MTGRILKQNSSALRRCFTGLCPSVPYIMLAAILAISAPASLSAADNNPNPNDGTLQVQCELSGGIYSDDGDIGIGEQCCWPNWGCQVCDIEFKTCEMLCDTLACCVKNKGCRTFGSADLSAVDFADRVKPPVQLAPESKSTPGLCGAGVAGSLPFGLLGLVGMVGLQRGRRYRRSAGRN